MQYDGPDTVLRSPNAHLPPYTPYTTILPAPRTHRSGAPTSHPLPSPPVGQQGGVGVVRPKDVDSARSAAMSLLKASSPEGRRTQPGGSARAGRPESQGRYPSRGEDGLGGGEGEEGAGGDASKEEKLKRVRRPLPILSAQMLSNFSGLLHGGFFCVQMSTRCFFL